MNESLINLTDRPKCKLLTSTREHRLLNEVRVAKKAE
jgi:hypothetical protein